MINGTHDIGDVFSILFSMMLGIVLAIMLYHIYNPLVIHKGPNSRHIIGQKYKYRGNEYEFEAEIVE